ncbi:hypothetical protein [Bradyrhizobium sp. Tv2a-2]|nr:hypothetical protein [Bradyrhizobium sp. Tv2a-2]
MMKDEKPTGDTFDDGGRAVQGEADFSSAADGFNYVGAGPEAVS